MATYNGGKYLKQQLDSIIAQTNPQWHLYIHDDGSTDDTLLIVNEYQEKHEGRITLMKYPTQGGAMKNFLSMLQEIEADYYMFCDQDDVWYPNKIECLQSVMCEVERTSKGKPVVVHCDLTVVDDELNIINESMWSMMNMHPQNIQKLSQYVMNVATGCAMLFNREARNSALRIPYTHALMHDTWVTIRAVADGGTVKAVPIQLVYYRQHENNTLGAKDYRIFNTKYRVCHIKSIIQNNILYYKMLRNAGYGSIFAYILNKIRFHV